MSITRRPWTMLLQGADGILDHLWGDFDRPVLLARKTFVVGVGDGVCENLVWVWGKMTHSVGGFAPCAPLVGVLSKMPSMLGLVLVRAVTRCGASGATPAAV